MGATPLEFHHTRSKTLRLNLSPRLVRSRAYESQELLLTRDSVQPSMATIHSLAPETVCNVFELAHDPHKTETMLAASLVCRAWREPAQRALFQDIVVRVHTSSETCMSFASLSERWARFSSKRLYTPVRAELVSPEGTPWFGVLGEGSPEFEWIHGAKHLIVGKFMLDPWFLADKRLQSLPDLPLPKLCLGCLD